MVVGGTALDVKFLGLRLLFPLMIKSRVASLLVSSMEHLLHMA